MNEVPPLEDSIEIEAPRDRVWDVISDIRRLAEWSPQVESTRLSGDHEVVELGTRFTNLNRHGELTWKTHGTIVTFEPGHEIAFRIEENWAIWSFRIEESDHHTVILTQRRDAPDGVSDLSRDLTEAFMGGQQVFTDTMRAGMRQTLREIEKTLRTPPSP